MAHVAAGVAPVTDTTTEHDDTPPEPVWELRTQVPPGYFELVQHESDDDMLAALDEMLEPHLDQLTDADVAGTRTQLLTARHMLAAVGLQIGGVVITAWEGRASVWMYGVWLAPVQTDIGLNPVGLIERILASAVSGTGRTSLAALLSGGEPEDFDLLGGRVGSSLYTTADASALPLPPEMAGVDLPASAGVVLAAVPMPELPEVGALVMGAAPTVEERGAMAIGASVIAHTAHLMPIDEPDVKATQIDVTLADLFGFQPS